MLCSALRRILEPPFPRLSYPGRPEAILYPILERMSSLSQSLAFRATPYSGSIDISVRPGLVGRKRRVDGILEAILILMLTLGTVHRCPPSAQPSRAAGGDSRLHFGAAKGGEQGA